LDQRRIERLEDGARGHEKINRRFAQQLLRFGKGASWRRSGKVNLGVKDMLAGLGTG
jgi:hypothetical protein